MVGQDMAVGSTIQPDTAPGWGAIVSDADERQGELLDVREVARLLKVSVSTVERLTRRGELPSVKFGRSRRYFRADVMAYLEAHREG
jgi:excisionase family DNA binding protein